MQGQAHKLMPPIDVMFVQYVHRLSPVAYQQDFEDALAAAASRIPCTKSSGSSSSAVGTSLAPASSGSSRTDSWSSSFGSFLGRSGSSSSSATSFKAGRASFRAAAAAQQSKAPMALPPMKLGMTARLLAVHVAHVKHSYQVWGDEAMSLIQQHGWRHAPNAYDPLYLTDTERRQVPAGTAFASRLRCDIVASAQRQKDFITNVFNACIIGDLRLAAKRFAAFVAPHQLHPEALLAPTYDIDLAWHASSIGSLAVVQLVLWLCISGRDRWD